MIDPKNWLKIARHNCDTHLLIVQNAETEDYHPVYYDEDFDDLTLEQIKAKYSNDPWKVIEVFSLKD
jgi:hypothetical protein